MPQRPVPPLRFDVPEAEGPPRHQHHHKQPKPLPLQLLSLQHPHAAHAHSPSSSLQASSRVSFAVSSSRDAGSFDDLDDQSSSAASCSAETDYDDGTTPSSSLQASSRYSFAATTAGTDGNRTPNHGDSSVASSSSVRSQLASSSRAATAATNTTYRESLRPSDDELSTGWAAAAAARARAAATCAAATQARLQAKGVELKARDARERARLLAGLLDEQKLALQASAMCCPPPPTPARWVIVP